MLVTGPRASVTGRYRGEAVGLAVRRRELDTWLLSQAVAAGARFESGLVARRPLMEDASSGLVRGLGLLDLRRQVRMADAGNDDDCGGRPSLCPGQRARPAA